MKRKRKKRHRFVRIILILISTFFLAFSALVGYTVIREGEVADTLTDDIQYDAIVVLGAQVKPDGTPSVQLSWRLDAAAGAFQKKNVPVVVCGAQGTDEPCAEATAMKQYLMDQGVSEAWIREDPESFNTLENLENAKELLSEFPDVCRILIVTSDYHVPRSLAIAKDLGYKAAGLGSPCKKEYWLKNHAREALAWCKYWARKYLKLPF